MSNNHTNSLVPVVIEKTSSGERSFDIYSRLLRDRIIMLDTAVTEQSASLIVAQMLFLDSQGSDDINFYINSPGGSVTAGLAIYDTMQFIKADVSTIALGQCCSMGSLLASAGAPGKRFILPYARHMIHQVSSGTQGTAADMQIQMDETKRLNRELTGIYVKHNSAGKTYEELEKDMSRDFYMTAASAVAYGLADKVIERK